jgi:hypothetical protein
VPYDIHSPAIAKLAQATDLDGSPRFSAEQLNAIIARANTIEAMQAAGEAGIDLADPALAAVASYSLVEQQRLQTAIGSMDPRFGAP